MPVLTYERDLEDAVAEARAYNRMGALDDNTLADIAYDYHVEISEIERELAWDDYSKP